MAAQGNELAELKLHVINRGNLENVPSWEFTYYPRLGMVVPELSSLKALADDRNFKLWQLERILRVLRGK